MSEMLDLISDLTASLEAASERYDIPEDMPCPHKELCHHPLCHQAGCVADKIMRGRRIMADAGWPHIPGAA